MMLSRAIMNFDWSYKINKFRVERTNKNRGGELRELIIEIRDPLTSKVALCTP